MQLWRKSAVAVASVVLLVVLSSNLSAQNNGNPSILAAVQAVQATLNGLVGSGSSLVTTVNGLVSSVASLATTVASIKTDTTEGSSLATPSITFFQPDSVVCSVTNVNANNRSVELQLINANTAAVISSATSPNLGTSRTSNLTSPAPANGIRVYCKITVQNGVKSDVRGAIALFTGASGSDKDGYAAF